MTDIQPTILDREAVRAAIKARTAAENTAAAEQVAASYRFIKPFSLAADGLIEFASNPDGRFMTGLHDIDVMTRGFAPGELVYVAGRSHSGKTQVVLNAINNNRDKLVVIFTPDETAELILSKLVSISRGVDAEQVEEKIKAGDQATIDMVRRVATHDFANLIVLDDNLSLDNMTAAVHEAEEYTGKKCALVVVDYLEILSGGGDEVDGVIAMSKAIKAWGKPHPWPTLVLRQNSRTSGKRGMAAGISGMGYGGENEAIIILEVFRKLENPDLDDYDLAFHKRTVTVNVCKNKRPPSKKGEVDFFMDPNTGAIRKLLPEDHVVAGRPTTSAADAFAQRAVAQRTQGWVDRPMPFDNDSSIEEPF